MLKGLSEADFNQLAKFLSYPRGMSSSTNISQSLYRRGQKMNMLMRQIGKSNLYLFNTDLREVRNFYVNNLANSSAKYLKTPSIIVTYNDMVTTGGHNLSSGITRVKSLTNYHGSGSAPASPPTTPKQTANPTTPKPTSGKSPAPKPATSPTVAKTTAKTSAPSTTTAKTSTNYSGSAVRSRSAVVSNASRSNRGF